MSRDHAIHGRIQASGIATERGSNTMKKMCMLLALLLSVAATACSSPDPATSAAPAPTSTQEDTRVTLAWSGGELTLPAPAERVVILDNALQGYLIQLDVRPVGTAADSADEPPVHPAYRGDVDWSDVPIVAPAFEPDIEAIAALEPDLILGGWWLEPAVLDNLEAIAPVVPLNNDADPEKPGFELFEANLRLIATAVGLTERAEAALAGHEERVDELKERYADIISQTTVSYARFDAFPEELRLDGPQGFGGAILDQLGFRFPDAQQELFAELTAGDIAAYVSGERIDLLDSDAIIAPVDQGEAVPTDHPLLADLPAVRDGQVFEVDMWRWFSRSILGADKVLDDLERILTNLDEGQ